MKSDVFNTEINYIKDKRLRDNLVIILNMLPDYFYEVPASSTGKYHPSFSLGEGGAGTFSDGKLNTLVKDKYFRMKEVFKTFVECGAPEEIMYDSKPHTFELE